jgi:hypothetical protein
MLNDDIVFILSLKNIYLKNNFYKMYKLAVGAIFKNESNSIKEWVKHYLYHGVDHFYLIDDTSTDTYLEEIQEYIDSGLITLFRSENWGYYYGRQADMYNKFILPKFREKEMEWLLMVDLDEYMWCPNYIDLKVYLYSSVKIGEIQVEHTIFGSNGHIKQPNGIVKNFTRRGEQPTSIPGNRKYFANSSYNFTSLNVHDAMFVNKEEELNNFILLDKQYYIMNHYSCQSKEFWNLIKCTRGDSDSYRNRTPEDFVLIDQNMHEDLGLFEQNKNIK